MARKHRPIGRKYDGPPHLKPLDAQEILFIEEYLKCLSAPEAAIAAGYAKSVAWSVAYQWIRGGKEASEKPHVAFVIETELARRAKKNELTAERIMKEVARLAFSDIRRLYNDEGALKAMHELDDDTAAAVAGVDVEHRQEGRGEDAEHFIVKKTKLYDKVASLNMAARILGMLKDKVEATVELKNPTLNVVLKPPAGYEIPAAFLPQPASDDDR